ncbi:polyketide cyclase [Bordetella genomosp. 1]|uniref:Polyketide cyclase n=1 Tax=Bordetella genomosp. 1 TaxID=1395607 RepID=A0A261STR0_9BORD|nr:nuclear transport factor 2 family protein [Bordetella genomosp. 1]MDQ8030378.1 nuclear transport factor 2 family protein [Bordetella sp.]OZI40250.1 polyketide cyclase [Bordetella genomosp. 1]OZI68446.1 polyketide cyclase [Bordetella genomosp. 1]
MKFKTLILAAAAALCLAGAAPVFAQNAQQNKETVLAFFRLMFQEHKVEEAVTRYVDSRYVQHNPYLDDGVGPLTEFFIPYFEQHPQASAEIKRVIAEGDLVVIHNHWKETPDDRGQAVIDIFRVANGKIVEHWDVSQEIPENPANRNGMF